MSELNIFKKGWDGFTDSLGLTIFHPQYFLKAYEHQAVISGLKYATGTLVDIGCGRQPYKKYFTLKVKKYIGVDHPNVSKKYKFGEAPDILADAEKIPLGTNFSDINLMISVLEHFPNPEKALKESFRINKKGGYIVAVTIQNYRLHDEPYDFFRYTKYGLRKIMENAGYTVKLVKPLGNYPTLALQYLNVFMLYKLKIGIERGRILKYICLFLLPFIYFICLLSNILALVINKFFDLTDDPSFAIYNLAIAQKK